MGTAKAIKKHGIDKKKFSLKTPIIKKIINDYAREPGVRVMEQMIAKLCRKAALTQVESKRSKKFEPKASDLEKLIWPPRFVSELAQKGQKAGVVTGLAWTSFGGEILFIETLPPKERVLS